MNDTHLFDSVAQATRECLMRAESRYGNKEVCRLGLCGLHFPGISCMQIVD